MEASKSIISQIVGARSELKRIMRSSCNTGYVSAGF